MSDTEENTVIFYLRDYLQPGGRYPYDRLEKDMESARLHGKKVYLISVPGHLIGSNNTIGQYLWSDCNGNYYKTAKDLLSMKNGKRMW